MIDDCEVLPPWPYGSFPKEWERAQALDEVIKILFEQKAEIHNRVTRALSRQAGSAARART